MMMSVQEQQDFIKKLQSEFGKDILLDPFPKPYCKDILNVKAIYLGCDPSNKFCRCLEYVFALPDGDPPIFKQMVESHSSNLALVGLNWSNVYVQNLCQNYFKEETSKNLELWKKIAEKWIPLLHTELDQFDNKIPVLLTSEYLYKVLVPGKKYPAKSFYQCERPVPIPATENRLERPLIPFYRNRRKVDYHLSNEKWSRYKESIKEYFKQINKVIR